MRSDERTRIHRMYFGAKIFTVSFGMFSMHAESADIGIAAGHGDEVQVVSVGARTPRWMSGEAKRWSWEVAGEWQLAKWISDHPRDGVEALADGSITAVLTLKRAAWRSAYLRRDSGCIC